MGDRITEKSVKVYQILKNLTSCRFYGKVELIFRDGKIVRLKKEETYKLD